MISHRWLFSTSCAAVLLGALATAHLSAQQSAPGAHTPVPTANVETFSFEIGHAARANAVYTIDATQPATSKSTGQKIRLKIVETTLSGTTTRYFSLATGKHKTVAQLDATLVEIFRRFVTTSSPTPGQELGKIGDLRYGGEVRFVIESADDLRFDNMAPNEPARASHYSRADIEALLAALTGTPSA